MSLQRGTVSQFEWNLQLLPVIRRRAAERGLSGGVGIPLTLALIGFVTFVVGAWLG